MWARTYYLAGDIDAVAASPDGSAVFVTGAIRKNGVAHYGTIGYDAGTGAELIGQSSSSGAAYATIAYNASTGRQLWVSRDNWVARALVMSPDGKTVYVTGYAFASNLDYVTIAYNAATGARRWLARYNDTSNGGDEGGSVGISPTAAPVSWPPSFGNRTG